MAKYLGIPLTVSNGNKIPLTAQPEIFSNNTFEGTPIVNGDNLDLAPNWRLRSTAGTSSTFTSDGVSFIWTGGNSTYLRAANGATNLDIFEIGKAYEITYTINESSEDNNLRIENGTSLIQLTTKLGKNTKKFIAKQTHFTLIRNSSVLSGSVEVQSIYLKEIAATETPTYGSPELVENGDFDTNSDWSYGNGWDIDVVNNKATYDGSGSQYGAIYQVLNTVIGKTYKMTFTLSGLSGGTVNFGFGTDIPSFVNPQKSYGSNGTYTRLMVASLTNHSIIVQNNVASQTFSIDNVSVKEVPYVIGTREFVKNGDFNESTDWSGTNWTVSGNGKAVHATTNVDRLIQSMGLVSGKKYAIQWTVADYSSGTLGVSLNSGTKSGDDSVSADGTYNTVLVSNGEALQIYASGVASLSSVSVKELEYNYLQVADGGFTKSVKEGDVIFNTSTSTEGVVKQVIDNNVLLMSNDNFSTAGEFFNVFAANGDTRGNQIVRIDNYIMSEYDEDPSNPQESSFWYAGGVDADKVTLTHLVPATNTFFVADLIESYTERLNNQSATASRLDIPLDAFRDHKNNEVLATTSITLS